MSEADAAVNVGVFVAHTPSAGAGGLQAFARQLAEAAQVEMEAATAQSWHFHETDPVRLADDEPRRPSDYLDEASLRMAEGPYDIVLVLTDVALVSSRRRTVAGLASGITRVAILSTRRLLVGRRGSPARSLDDEEVRANALTLLLHLLGHTLGLEHSAGDDAMRPYAYEEGRRAPLRFSESQRRRLRGRRLPQRETDATGWLATLAFHLGSAARHPRQVLSPPVRSRAPLLSLSLPGLATAALVPIFILVFTAEIWDVGLNMPDGVAWGFAAASIVAATWYLTAVQNLFFPRKEKRILSEHLAAANVSVFLAVLLGMTGLFVMVLLLVLAIETLVFPPGLISTWPTLGDPVVTLTDKLRIAAFISTIGVLTGALAGGLEKRALVRHLALFREDP